jgi:hypothetical protein
MINKDRIDPRSADRNEKRRRKKEAAAEKKSGMRLYQSYWHSYIDTHTHTHTSNNNLI